MKAAIIIILLALGVCPMQSRASDSPKCSDMRAPDKARLVGYFQKKFNLDESTHVQVQEGSLVDDSCYRRLLFTWDGAGRRLHKDMLVSPDFRFLTRELLDSSLDPEEEARIETGKIAANLSRGDGASRGLADAPVTLVLFSDFQCPFCSQMAAGLINDILPKERERVRLIFRNFPLEGHPWARAAAEAMACVREQNEDGFWALHDYVFAHQSELGDGLSELLAALRLRDRKREQCLHAAHRTAAQTGAAVVQDRHRHFESLALCIQHVLGGNPHVREIHAGGRRGTDAHFVLVRPMAHARPRRLHHESGNLAALR